MENHDDIKHFDYGTGEKKLNIYIIGLISCVALTLISFWTVMSKQFNHWQTLSIIYLSACIQLIIQIICFLRLNTKTKQAQMNVMSIIFTLIILLTIIFGSLWIMWSLNYNMMN